MQNRTYKRYWPQWLIPMLGSTCLTLLIIGTLLWFQVVSALPMARVNNAITAVTTVATTTIPYQGYVMDADGRPLSGSQNITFKLYNQSTGGSPLWTENRQGANRISVDDGFFNTMLGSVTPLPRSVIMENEVLYLGISIGADAEMNQRVQLGHVPYSVVADTVRDGSITTAKLADGAVTSRQYHPQIGATRLSETVSMNLGPRLTNHTVPSTDVAISIDFPAKLMINYSTTFDPDISCSYDVILMVNGSPKYVSSTSGSGWQNHAGHVLLDASPGNYNVSLEIHGSTCNNPQLRFVYDRTSLIYQVVGR